MRLLPEIDKTEVQEDGLVIRAHLQSTAVHDYRPVRALGTRVDHAEITECGYVAWLLAENGLEPSLRGLVLSGPEGPHRPIEGFFRRLGAT